MFRLLFFCCVLCLQFLAVLARIVSLDVCLFFVGK